MAKFSGVEIFTYVGMDNHFHILLKVPDRKKWLKRFEVKEGEPAETSEGRLLKHLSIVYSKVFSEAVTQRAEELPGAGTGRRSAGVVGSVQKTLLRCQSLCEGTEGTFQSLV